jgi:hypothetical protein
MVWFIMPNGGARRGAGRKPSAVKHEAERKVRIRTREMLDQAAAEGVMPITVMLESMRFLYGEAHQDGAINRDTLMAACAVAAQAAPYVHRRLSALQAKIGNISDVRDGAFELRLATVLEALDALAAPEDEDEPKALPAPVDEAAE